MSGQHVFLGSHFHGHGDCGPCAGGCRDGCGHHPWCDGWIQGVEAIHRVISETNKKDGIEWISVL